MYGYADNLVSNNAVTVFSFFICFVVIFVVVPFCTFSYDNQFMYKLEKI